LPSAAVVLSPWTDLALTGQSLAEYSFSDPIVQVDLMPETEGRADRTAERAFPYQRRQPDGCFTPQLRVEACHRFVGQQHARPLRQRPASTSAWTRKIPETGTYSNKNRKTIAQNGQLR
jgi:hypothetical protein